MRYIINILELLVKTLPYKGSGEGTSTYDKTPCILMKTSEYWNASSRCKTIST
jgi:hypothetical protein